MTFSIDHNNPAVIAVAGHVIGGAEGMQFSQAIGELVRGGERCVIVDLALVPVMNSSGLGMLVGASSTLRSAGGLLVVAGANEKITALFKMTRLDSVLPQYATREEALAASQ
ncbi:MAG: STAS domain-containing protein [Bacteroidetes bacterium]|nr:STAS domain-containing protein [Bacteroidota bacterium]